MYQLQLLTQEDEKKLFEFEKENRVYFEQMVPERGHDYYDYAIFQKRHAALLAEQEQQQSYFFLIKDEYGQIIGRMNVTDIGEQTKSGEVGYRIGERFVGRGLASFALKLLIAKAPSFNLKQLTAKTTSNNVASQKILEKNNFNREADGKESFLFKGEIVHFVYYRWKEKS
ncbi:GNAT family N-acetyltransferase [Alkalihalobacillus sp. 1P02AB]|uniref:GNAT family N-acetyltransferase n=1 Tax=Alkalihalobacillus sp. 1P02AB TaxID=3132260 RepID=UPI0039A6EA27